MYRIYAIIALTGILVYSNTLNAPFQWDDNHFIGENPFVKDLGYFAEPSKGAGHELYGAFKSRYIGYLTFALNYRLHGLDTTGYHVFNISVHILTAVLVFLFVRYTFMSPLMSSSALAGKSRLIGLFAALFFISHPVQTEAVTYVFQRLASLCAFFYLLSVVLYIKWRLTPLNLRGESKGGYIALYLLSLLSALLAMKTKENAFTLGISLSLYEFLFFSGPLKRRVCFLIPFVLTMLVIPLTLAGTAGTVGEVIGSLGPASRGFEQISREDYLFTQYRVIVTYMRLLVLPVGQNIDHDYGIFFSFRDPQVFLSFAFITAVILFGAYLMLVSIRRKRYDLRLPAFGILWFFITLSVESSVIPIPMVINEYRLYLPSAGAFIAITYFLFSMPMRFKKAGKTLMPALILIVAVLSISTFLRNDLWRSETALWEDTVRKSPLKARPRNNLGLAYRSKGENEKAEREFKAALLLRPDYSFAHYNLALLYKNTGRTDEAIEQFKAGLSFMPGDAEAHNHLGTLYGSKGMPRAAAEQYLEAVRLKPDFPEAHFNLGLVFIENGLLEEAKKEFIIVLSLNPEDYDAWRFLNYISGTK